MEMFSSMWSFLANIAADSALNSWIAASYWLWPILEIIHFVGLTLLLGGLIVVDLSMAGHLKGVRPASAHQLLPLVVLGFALNLITGILFFYGDPGRYSINIGFQVKMLLVMLAGLNALFYHWRVNPLLAGLAADAAPPLLARTAAYTSLSLWTGVLLTGRLIPYVGTG